MTDEPGHLYVVSTPIGNLDDISPRALETLSGASLILAEDTRHSRRLLDRYGIRTKLASYHEHNEARATPGLVERLVRGESFALISDAGTPLLSDPGARLVSAAIEAGVRVVPIPGASALLSALVVSGIETERFTFYGFLPRKGRERSELLDEIGALTHTAVLYEAPGRVPATMAELAKHGGAERPAAVARELTKQFEEVRRGTVGELAAYYESSPPRGEVVIVLAGNSGMPAALDEVAVRTRARALREAGVSARDVARTLIADYGIARNAAYRLAQDPDSYSLAHAPDSNSQ